MSRLYLVRHGEAAGHEVQDPGLSDHGRRQVHALVRRLRARAISEVWHGPRRRTTETAELVAAGLGVAHCAPTDLLDDRSPVPSAARRGDYPAHCAPWFAIIARDDDGQARLEAFNETAHLESS